MARINVEDSWWTDPRRNLLARLVGKESTADGIALKAWRVSQEYWRKKELIPLDVFEALEGAAELLQAKIAEVREGGVYLKGSTNHHKWLEERIKTAAKGGKKSAQRPRDAKGRLISSKQTPSKTQATSSTVQRSSSSSFSEYIPVSSKPGEIVPIHPEKGLEVEKFNPVTIWMAAYKHKYGLRYELSGRDRGTLVRAFKDRPAGDLARLVACYLSIESKLYTEAKHPLSLFFRDLQRISVAAQTGVNPAEKEKTGIQLWAEQHGLNLEGK